MFIGSFLLKTFGDNAFVFLVFSFFTAIKVLRLRLTLQDWLASSFPSFYLFAYFVFDLTTFFFWEMLLAFGLRDLDYFYSSFGRAPALPALSILLGVWSLPTLLKYFTSMRLQLHCWSNSESLYEGLSLHHLPSQSLCPESIPLELLGTLSRSYVSDRIWGEAGFPLMLWFN